MAKINSYPQVIPTNDDLILGTDVNQADRPTKNFKVSDLIALVTGGATGLGAVISLNSSAKDPVTPFANQSATDFLNISGTGTVTFNSLTDGTFNTTGGATTTTTLTTTGDITSNATVQAATFQTTGGVATWTTTVLAGFTSITTDALAVNGAVSGTSLIIATDLAGATNANIASTLAIKTYVDDKVANLDTLSELLAKNPSPAVNPSNTTGGTDILVSAADDITFTDTSKIIMGTGADATIEHDGTDLKIVNTVGKTTISNSSGDIDISATAAGKKINIDGKAGVDLIFDTTPRFSVLSTGAKVTGVTTSTGVFQGPDGTTTLPTYGFTGDVNTGMYGNGNGEVKLTSNGNTHYTFANAGATFTNGLSPATLFLQSDTFTTTTTTSLAKITRFVLSTDPANPQTNPATFGLFVPALANNTMIPTTQTVKTYVDTVAGNKVLKYQADAAATGTMPFLLNLSTDSLDIAGGTNMNTSTLDVTAGNLGIVTVNLDDNVTLPTGSGKGTYTGTKYTDGTMSIEAGVGTDFISITTSPNSSQPPGAVNANGFFGPLRASASSTNITAGVADQAVKLVDIGRASVANDIQLYPTFSLSTNEIVASNATAIVLASIPINNQTPIIGQALTGTDVVADTLITNVQVNTPTNKVTITVDKQQTSGIAASTSLTFTTSAPIYTSGGNATIPTFLPNTVATSKLLTGLSTGVSSSILSSDTILGGMEKLQAQISATTGLSYEGLWNASTDSPALSGTTPASGVFYIVNVAGNTNLSGITDWLVGDWAIYVSNGSATDGWQKLDQTSEITGGGGSAGDMAMFTSAQNIAPSVINQTGSAGSFAVSLGSNADLEVTGNTQLGDSDSDTTLVKGSLTAEKNVIINEGLGVPIAGSATSYGIDGQALFSGNASDSTVSSNANVWTTVAWNLSTDSGNEVVANGNTVTLSGGDGIATSESSGTVTTAIRYADSDAAGTKKNAIEIAGDATPVLTDKFWFSDANANTNINEIKKASISAIKTLTAESWILSDGTNTTTISDGDTATFTAAGTGIAVAENNGTITITGSENPGTGTALTLPVWEAGGATLGNSMVSQNAATGTKLTISADDPILVLDDTSTGAGSLEILHKSSDQSAYTSSGSSVVGALTYGSHIFKQQQGTDTATLRTMLTLDTDNTAKFNGDVSALSSKFISTSSATAKYLRLYAGSGTGQWDIYGNGGNLRISDNLVGSSGILAVDSGASFGGNVSVTGTLSTTTSASIGTTLTTGGSITVATHGLLSIIGGNNLTISGTAANHAGLSFATQAILPATVSATNNDVVDLGANGNQFKDLYLSGNVIHGGSGTGTKGGTFNKLFTSVAAGSVAFTIVRATSGAMVFDVMMTSDTSNACSIAKKFTVVKQFGVDPVVYKILDTGPDLTVDFTPVFAQDTTDTSIKCTITPNNLDTQKIGITIDLGFGQNDATVVMN